MGAYVDVNKALNLTWNFEIDPGFLYLVRLHWCDSEMVKVNQRIFDVIINNMTAAHKVDLFGLTNAIATPIVKDYVVLTENVTDSSYRLWVSLAPTNGTRPQFMEGLLNGLEIFKMSDNFGTNIAAPNPAISDLMRKYLEGHKMEPKALEGNVTTLIITCGAAAVAVFCVLYRRKRRAGGNGDSRTSWLPISRNSNTTKSSSVVAISTDAASNCRYFSLVEIMNATNNFDESNIIGVGGLGKVYKGVIDGKTKPPSRGRRGSKYASGRLHTGSKYTIIHRRRKMGVQGVRFWPLEMPRQHGGERQQLSEKSDVYSFGVVLFEVLYAQTWRKSR